MHEMASTRADEGADYGVLRWLVAATFVVILNETIMVNAIPHLTVEFKVSALSAQWLSTAFMLTMAVVIPASGWFLQKVTTRQAFALAMGVFCTGTLLAAFAPTFGVLVAARVIQASGTAVMMPLLMTTLMSVVPERDRGRVMGNVTLAISVAPALGPAVSGLILGSFSWRWIFGFVLPIAGAIGFVGLRRLRNVPGPSAGRLDVLSVIISALGFGGLVYGLSEIQGSNPALAWSTMAGGLVLIALFALRQLFLQRADRQPLLDLRTLQHRTFTVGLLTMSVAFMAFLGAMILLPFYLQQVRGLSILNTGLLMMPGGLAMGLLGPQVGKVFDRVGARILIVPGTLAVIAGLAVLTQVSETTPIWLILTAHVTMMIGLAAVFTPLFTLSLGAVPPQLYSYASSLLGALQQVAGAMGTAVVITLMSGQRDALLHAGHSLQSAMVGGMRSAFEFGLVAAVLMALIGWLMPNRGAGEGAHGPVPEPEVDAVLVADAV